MSLNIKISAVVCTYNRENYILQALSSLINQTLPSSEYEIVIVNNNSTDSTEKICLEFTETHKEKNIKYVIERSQGLSFARNKGIKESTGELIAFIDDDAIADEDYLKNAVNFFEQNKTIDAIGGKVTPVYNKSEPEWLSKYLWGLVSKVDYGEQIRQFPKNKYPAGCNMIFRKQLLMEVGMFNTDLKIRSDDKYIFYEIRKYNKLVPSAGNVLYVPTVNVLHYVDDYRLTPLFIKKLSMVVGQSERIRLKNAGVVEHCKKIIEYKIKLAAAIVLSFQFILRFQFSKAFYLIMNRWYILIGYFKKSD